MPPATSHARSEEPGPARRAYVPSSFVMRRIVNPLTVRLGGPTLVVRGRRSGHPMATPVPAFRSEGAPYLGAGGGETL